MNWYKLFVFPGVGVLAAGCLVISPAVKAAGKSSLDSQEVARPLSDAKSEALELKKDAEVMESYSKSKFAGRSHAQAIDRIKGHINEGTVR